jgi:hypothetical protein
MFVRQYPGTGDKSGMIPSDNNFDAVSCIDGKEKLYFPDVKSSATLS